VSIARALRVHRQMRFHSQLPYESHCFASLQEGARSPVTGAKFGAVETRPNGQGVCAHTGGTSKMLVHMPRRQPSTQRQSHPA
jgi:hypothetical protein